MLVNELDSLGTRAKNLLIKNGITTVDKMLETPNEVLLGFKNGGKGMAYEIEKAKEAILAERGNATFADDDVPYGNMIAAYAGYGAQGTFFFLEGDTFTSTARVATVFYRTKSRVGNLDTLCARTMDEVLAMSAKAVDRAIKLDEPAFRALILERGVFFPSGYEYLVAKADAITEAFKECFSFTLRAAIQRKDTLTRAFSKACIRAVKEGIDAGKIETDVELYRDAIRQEELRETIQDILRDGNQQLTSVAGLRDIICKELPESVVAEAIAVVPEVTLGEDGSLSYRPMTIMEYANSLPDTKAKEALLRRLGGETIASAGKSMGLSHERVRQLTDTALQGKPPLMDVFIYIKIFQKFRISREEFLAIFTDDALIAYRYLKVSYKKGKRQTRELLKTTLLEDADRKRLESYLIRTGEGFIIKGVATLRNYPAVVEQVIKTQFGKEPVENDVLLEAVKAELAKNGTTLNLSASSSGWHNILNTMPNVLKHSHKEYRYYPPKRQVVQKIIEALPLEEYMDKRISSTILWRRVMPLMEKYDIRNGYELHSVLKNNESMLPAYVSFCHNPMLDIGEVDFKKQAIETALASGSLSNMDVARAMKREYGFNLASLQARADFRDVISVVRAFALTQAIQAQG